MEVSMTAILYRLFYIPVLIFTLYTLLGCATAPITGRSQLLLFPENQEITLGIQAYQEVLAKQKISHEPKVNSLVKSVGKNIAKAADRPDYDWEFTVIDDNKTANAFALPGGKVAVYTGLLPYTNDENGLAFVLAHEVGHALARHGGERMSQMLIIQLGQIGINVAVRDQSPVAIQALNIGYGLASTVGVILPFSRTQEYEADTIGLIIMAKAGYDPREAPAFFERLMQNSAEKKKPPVFLSTHPADEDRIARLKSLIPEAMKYYKP